MEVKELLLYIYYAFNQIQYMDNLHETTLNAGNM